MLRRAFRASGLAGTLKRARRRYRQSLRHWAPLDYPGVKLTPARLLNYALLRWEEGHGQTRLRASPLVLVIETGNVCNLRCPSCFTGVGEAGRRRSFFPMPLYRRLMNELGDRLLMVELCNWGEPFLNADLEDMIALASARGASTITSTHFSIDLDESRAERVVSAGLSVLGVSLDGATQETYQRYRIGGDLNRALANVRLVRSVRDRMGSPFPRITWEYHVFPHNAHEVEAARRIASDEGMDFSVSKGWVNGPDPAPRGPYEIHFSGTMPRCRFLWQRAVVHNDGGVAPCDGCFYREDDFGSLGDEPTISAGDLAAGSFREVWNNASFVAARALFRDAKHLPAQRLICASCPVTSLWHGYRHHVAAGLPSASYDPGFTENDGHNFFISRSQALRGIDLPLYDQRVSAPPAPASARLH